MREAENGTDTDGPFALSVERRGLETIVRVCGEVDLSTCDRLRDVIEPFIEAGETLVIDLAGVEYMDSSCLRVLAVANVTIGERGGSFSLRNPSTMARRVLEIAGLSFLLDVGGQ